MAKWFAPGLKLEQSGPFLELAAKYGQPAESAMPTELLSLGLKMFARGLYTSLVYQTRTNWKWPYWLERQSNPNDPAFQSIAHLVINQNRVFRNWTLLGLPDHGSRLVVDPAMMLTPLKDGYSIEFWIQEGNELSPVFSGHAGQDEYIPNRFPFLRRQVELENGLTIRQNVFVSSVSGHDFGMTRLKIKNTSGKPQNIKIWMAIRPYNPEGISPVHHLRYNQEQHTWWSGTNPVSVSLQPSLHTFCGSSEEGDVWLMARNKKTVTEIRCPAGLASGASVFSVTIAPGSNENLDFSFPLNNAKELTVLDWNDRDLFTYSRAKNRFYYRWNKKWDQKLAIQIPDETLNQLTVSCLTNQSVFCLGKKLSPGYLIYDDFWFRDAAFLGHMLLKSGQFESVREIILHFPDHQKGDGFFQSQEGEWDSNGQVLWLVNQYWKYTRDENLLHELYPALVSGARWIQKKRNQTPVSEVKGMLPAGFSAEHFGANDFYFWDNFWSIAGLEALSELATDLNYKNTKTWLEPEKTAYRERLSELVKKSMKTNEGVCSASPKRTFDAGAIGNVVTAYPLQLTGFEDAAFSTADRLLADFGMNGMFYHPVAHTGINIYLTLQLLHCQIYQRRTDFWADLGKIAKLAGPTGTWPEALHPQLLGGVMGEGHHGWANAEWASIIRDALVCDWNGELWVTPALNPAWLEVPGELKIKDTATPFGKLSFELIWDENQIVLNWNPDLHSKPKKIFWWLPEKDEAVELGMEKEKIQQKMDLKADIQKTFPGFVRKE